MVLQKAISLAMMIVSAFLMLFVVVGRHRAYRITCYLRVTRVVFIHELAHVSSDLVRIRAHSAPAAASATTSPGDIWTQAAAFEPPVPSYTAQKKPRLYGSTSTGLFQQPDVPAPSPFARPTCGTNLNLDSYYRHSSVEHTALSQPQAGLDVNREPTVPPNPRHSEEVRSRTPAQSQATTRRGEGPHP